MKKIFLLTGFILLALAVCAQVNCSKTHCSYFTLWNWQNSYPNLFSVQLDPSAETISFQPLSNEFQGVVSISVHDSLYCGNTPLCSFEFDGPASGIVAMPPGLMDCINEADPLYLKLCWRKSHTAQVLDAVKY